MPPRRQEKRRTAEQMDPIERRVRAAMWLAGIEDFPKLAEVIAERNVAHQLGDKTLRTLNAGTALKAGARRRRAATKTQLSAVADACGLPYEFFTVDFQRLPDIAANGDRPFEQRTLEDRIAELELWRDAVELEGREPPGEEGSGDGPVP